MRLNLKSISRLALVAGICAAPLNGAWGQEAGNEIAEAGESADRLGASPNAIDQVSRTDIVVTANSREELRKSLSPGAVSVIYPDDTRGEHKALPDLLDTIPGVYVRRVNGTGQYTTTSIRGSAPSQVNIYVDGVPYNTSNEVAVDISTIPISNVERIEIYRGNVPARFSGSPLGGAINIVTKKAKGWNGTVSGGVRSYDGWQASGNINAPLLGGNLLIGAAAEGSRGDFKYTHYFVEQGQNLITGIGEDGRPNNVYSTYYPGSGRHSYREYYEPAERKRLNNSFLSYNALARWTNDNFSAKYSFTHMERFSPISLYGSAAFKHADVAELAYPLLPPYIYHELIGLGEEENNLFIPDMFNPRKRQIQDQHDVALGWQDQFGELEVSTSVNFMDQVKSFRNLDSLSSQGIGTVSSDYHTRRFGGQIDLAYTAGRDAPITQRFELNVRGSQETMYADANAIGGSDYYTRFRRYLLNFQFQNTITIHPLGDLQITPIGRVERLYGPVLGSKDNPFGPSSGDYEWQGTWGVSAKKEFGNWLIFAGTGTYNRYPNFYEIYGDGIYVQAGSNSVGSVAPLLREYGRNSDVGIGWNGKVLGDIRTSFRATLFARKTNNTITYYPTPIGSKYVNSGTTLTRGAEFEGNLIFGKTADLQMAATYQNGRYVKGTYYYYGGTDAREMVGDNPLYTLNYPRFAANARLNVHLFGGALTAFADIKHVGRRYSDQGQRFEDGSAAFDYDMPLTTLELGAHYKFANGVSVSAGVSDITNEGPKQREGGQIPQRASGPGYDYIVTDMNVQYPQQGRTFYLTVAKSFGQDSTPRQREIAEATDWTGFHVGGTIGLGWAPVNANEWLIFDGGTGSRDGFFHDRVLGDQRINDDFFTHYANPLTDMFYEGYDGGGAALGANRAAGVRADRSKRVSYGFRAGYDHQIGDWVVGTVGEWAHYGLTDSISGYGSTTLLDPEVLNIPLDGDIPWAEIVSHYSNVPASYTFTRKLNSVASLRLRGGFVLGKSLFYGTGGIARADLDESFSTTDTLHEFEVRDAKKHRLSPQLGGGVETRIFGPFTLGLEYLHASFKGSPTTYATGYDGSADPDIDAQIAATFGQPTSFQACAVAAFCPGTDMKRSLDTYSVRSLRVTLGYRF